jgi:hypothetical protein
MTKRIWPQFLILLLALGFTVAPPAYANGGKAKNAVYDGVAQPKAGTGNGSFRFTIDTSPIIFYLGTVNNKYYVLLIRAVNQSDVPLLLAKDQDTIELQYSDGQKVKALLNLRAADGATWDSLDLGLRTAVAYPEVIKAREEEGIYLYVSVKDLAGPRKDHIMPSSIIYNIKSLPSPVELRPRGVAAA